VQDFLPFQSFNWSLKTLEVSIVLVRLYQFQSPRRTGMLYVLHISPLQLENLSLQVVLMTAMLLSRSVEYGELTVMKSSK